MGKLYGYMRVSTEDQKHDLQEDALIEYGVPPANILSDKITSKKTRPNLEKLFAKLEEGDKVVVWKLDRLGRSTLDLLMLLDRFSKKNVEFVSLNDSDMDTTTPTGKMIFTVVAAFANFERDLIAQRTREGIAAYRRKHWEKPWGRAPDFDEEQARSMKRLRDEGYSLRQIADMFDKTSHTTVLRALRRIEKIIGEEKRAKSGIASLL